LPITRRQPIFCSTGFKRQVGFARIRAVGHRARICEGLQFLGIEIDEARNAANASVISARASRVTVRVMHMDEEVMITKSVCRVLNLSTGKEKDHGQQGENA
jgi:hypothetical protein